jgi:hypothetical protein
MVRNPGDQNVISLVIKNPSQGFELPGTVGVPVEKHDGVASLLSAVQKNSPPVRGNFFPIEPAQIIDTPDAFLVTTGYVHNIF